MIHRMLRTLPLYLTLGALLASAQTLTPRELFYKSTAPAVAPAKPSVKPTPKPVAQKPPETQQPADPGAQPELTGGGKLVTTGSSNTLKPLGLRYSILKVTESGEREMSPDTLFRSGDKIRVSFQTNDAGYLYIVMLGSSGNWQVLFPSKDLNGGDNHITPGRSYSIPQAPNRFVFDENAGQEKLFIVLTRQPEANLDSLIYSLKPASNPELKESPKRTMFAVNKSVDDSTIGKLRNQYAARDLVFEKVDENTPGDRKESAVYVVNPDQKPDARLVVDLKLQHK